MNIQSMLKTRKFNFKNVSNIQRMSDRRNFLKNAMDDQVRTIHRITFKRHKLMDVRFCKLMKISVEFLPYQTLGDRTLCRLHTSLDAMSIRKAIVWDPLLKTWGGLTTISPRIGCQQRKITS